MPRSKARVSRTRSKLQCHYGIDCPGEVAMLFIYAIATGVCALVLFLYFNLAVRSLTRVMHSLPLQAWSFMLGFAVMIVGMVSLLYWVTIFHMLYTSLVVKFRVARQMVRSIANWEEVQAVLDIGCGRGLLLNTVALKVQKARSGGRVVGVDIWDGQRAKQNFMKETLENANAEGTDQVVTCKTGDARALPFSDCCFDVVVSALALHNVGAELGRYTPAAEVERRQALQEAVRVLKPGGQMVLWDIFHANEYAVALKELGMVDVKLSRKFAAFMVTSHIIFAKRPAKGS